MLLPRSPDMRVCLYLQVELFSQVSNGLADMHALNIIHLDLKPANILINRKHTFQIADFGLASYLPVVRAVPANH